MKRNSKLCVLHRKLPRSLLCADPTEPEPLKEPGCGLGLFENAASRTWPGGAASAGLYRTKALACASASAARLRWFTGRSLGLICTPGKLERIIQEHLVGGNVVREFAFAGYLLHFKASRPPLGLPFFLNVTRSGNVNLTGLFAAPGTLSQGKSCGGKTAKLLIKTEGLENRTLDFSLASITSGAIRKAIFPSMSTSHCELAVVGGKGVLLRDCDSTERHRVTGIPSRKPGCSRPDREPGDVELFVEST